MSDVNFAWQTAVPVNFASGVQDATPDAPMSSVSCSSAGNCAAVGQFQDSSGNYEAFWVNEVQGTWVQAVPALFAGGLQNAAPDAYFASVSCQTDGNCTAVGQFEDASGNYVAFGESETNFMLTQGSEVTFTSNAQQSVEVSNFTSVSCSSAGNCTGVGQYVDSAGDQEAFSETQSNGWWGTAQPAIFAYGTQNNVPDEQFDSVACVSVGNCTAAGQFYDLNGNYQGFVSTLSNGNWQTPQVLSFVGGVENSSPNVQTLSISCSSAGNCSTVGRFLDAGGQNEAFTASSVAMATSPGFTGSPVNVTATIVNSSATVSWTPTGAATSYTVTASQGDLTCTTTSTSCIIAGLTSDKTYNFNVVAHNADSSSNAGVSDWATTLKGSLVRPAVVHFSSFSGRGHDIVVAITNEPVGHTTWTSYAYYLSTTKRWVNTTLSSSHSFVLHHLKRGATYEIRLRARNSRGLGPSSLLETVHVS